MIRFSCSNCGKSLRAAAVLAGKKGRCAQCGTVNPVPGALAAPIVLSVDVKRAVATSPFRSTADYEPARATIEVAVQTAQESDPLPAPVRIDHPSRAFFDAAPLQIPNESAPYEGEEWEEPAPHSRRKRGVAAALGGHPLHASYDSNFEHRAHEVWRAVLAAMLVGAVIGFCVGLFCSKWIL